MNKNQKIVLCIGIIVFVLIGLFPPRHPNIRRVSRDDYDPRLALNDKINGTHLATYWAMVGVATGGLIALLKDKKTN